MSRKALKDRIIDLAREKFAAHGFKSVTTDELANQLGISKRTLYDVIDTKEALFETIVGIFIEEAKAKHKQIIDKILTDECCNLIEELSKLCRLTSEITVSWSKEFFSDLQKYTPNLWKKFTDFRDTLSREHFTQIAELGRKRGIFKSDINYQVVYLMHSFAIQNIMVPEVCSKLPLSIDEVLLNIHKIIFTGILAENRINQYCCNFNASSKPVL